jgi:hypothetical protein
MGELDPAHPVRRFRFVARRSPAPAETPPPQDDAPPASNLSRRDFGIDRADLDAAQRVAETIGDERLRQTILAALGAAGKQPPQGPLRGTPVNPK